MSWTEILPTPVEGGWIEVDNLDPATPGVLTAVEGGWIEVDNLDPATPGVVTAIEGGWIEVDLNLTRRPRRSVDILVTRGQR